MVDKVVSQWNDASFFQKFVLANIAFPWTPVLGVVAAYYVPEEWLLIAAEHWNNSSMYFSSAFGF